MEESYTGRLKLIRKERECGTADLSGVEGLDQRLLIHNSSSCGVDKDGAVFHRSKLLLVEESLCLCIQRHGKGDSIGLLEELVEISFVVDRSREGLLLFS